MRALLRSWAAVLLLLYSGCTPTSAGRRHTPRIRAVGPDRAPRCPALQYSPGSCPAESTEFHGCPITPEARARYLAMEPATTTLDIPCGFHGPTSYDHVRDHYLRRPECKIFVVTVIFRYYDNLFNPSYNWSAYDKQEVCWVALLDEESLVKPVLFQPYNVTIWELWRLDRLPYNASYLIHKSSLVSKILVHRLFPNAVFSVYVDGKVRLDVDPWHLIRGTLGVAGAKQAPPAGRGRAEYYAAHTLGGIGVLFQTVFRSSQHEFRTELTRLAHNRSAIRGMWHTYQNETDVTAGIWATPVDTAILVRAHGGIHRGCVELFGCAWWNEVVHWHFHSREQLSFPRVVGAWNLTGIFSYFSIGELFTWWPHRYQYRVLRIQRKLPKGHYVPQGMWHTTGAA